MTGVLQSLLTAAEESFSMCISRLAFSRFLCELVITGGPPENTIASMSKWHSVQSHLDEFDEGYFEG